MKTYSMPRLLLAGFLGTFIMTVILHPLFLERLPTLEFATIVLTRLGGRTIESYTTLWWVGVFEHLLNGVLIFPLLYSRLFLKVYKGNPLVGGVLWGVTLWLVTQVVVFPVLGYGVFASKVVTGSVNAPLTLFGHVVYGILFGSILGFPKRGKD